MLTRKKKILKGDVDTSELDLFSIRSISKNNVTDAYKS